ncbi:hypothetical protein [Thermus hydrothermalis]|uniref:hypothetical protein n=1 Tax=Thermus hydrothermalis TaxID=2908148 RepID=UPI001FAA3534|nr:hypothetical protein [Thermus hydrothermalis]
MKLDLIPRQEPEGPQAIRKRLQAPSRETWEEVAVVAIAAFVSQLATLGLVMNPKYLPLGKAMKEATVWVHRRYLKGLEGHNPAFLIAYAHELPTESSYDANESRAEDLPIGLL